MSATLIGYEFHNDSSPGSGIMIQTPEDVQEGDLLMVAYTCDVEQSSMPELDEGWRLARAKYESDNVLLIALRDATGGEGDSLLQIGHVNNLPDSSISACLVYRDALPQKYQFKGSGDIVTRTSSVDYNPVYSPGLIPIFLSGTSTNPIGPAKYYYHPSEVLIDERAGSSTQLALTVYLSWAEELNEWWDSTSSPITSQVFGSGVREFYEWGWVADGEWSPPTPIIQRYEIPYTTPPGAEFPRPAMRVLFDGEVGDNPIDEEELRATVEEMSSILSNRGWGDVNLQGMKNMTYTTTFEYVPEPEIDDWTV